MRCSEIKSIAKVIKNIDKRIAKKQVKVIKIKKWGKSNENIQNNKC